jgi:biotin-dependent carboxylase-like uncharacterized protein
VIEVLAPGPLTTIQDLGRPGCAAFGVGPSGAADRGSLRLANRLVGNAEGAAGLELTLGGLRARFARAAWIAVTGAPCDLTVGGREEAMNGPIRIPEGGELVVARPSAGTRSYIAVRGGIDVPPVLGARATDVLSGVGPPVLARGTRLPIGTATVGAPLVDLAPVPPWPDPFVLHGVSGPRHEWFTPSALTTLNRASWTVAPDSNRIALRLVGPPLRRRVEAELPSEGLVRGGIQVPPDGQPVLFLADHPLTGGYPVIAVIDEEDVDMAAQARPGQRLRLRVASARPRTPREPR